VPANLQSNVALKSTVSDLWQNVLSARTYQTYNVRYRTYTSCLASNGVIWIGKRMPPTSEDILIYFVVHCFKNLKLLHTTIKLYLCGIRSKRKQKLFLHAHHICIRISRIINKHFERPLFTIYTVASLSHKNKMRLEIHKCPHKTAATTMG
jgi:hypothetical protein